MVADENISEDKVLFLKVHKTRMDRIVTTINKLLQNASHLVV
jgi:hypothetical protein